MFVSFISLQRFGCERFKASSCFLPSGTTLNRNISVAFKIIYKRINRWMIRFTYNYKWEVIWYFVFSNMLHLDLKNLEEDSHICFNSMFVSQLAGLNTTLPSHPAGSPLYSKGAKLFLVTRPVTYSTSFSPHPTPQDSSHPIFFLRCP